MQGKAHEPTTESREAVKRYTASGVSRKRIAAALGITDDTLRKHYPDELELADGKWEADFEMSLGALALRADCPPAVKIFMAKVRLGYREHVAIDPSKEQPPEDLSNEQLRERVAKRARELRERPRDSGLPGTAEPERSTG